MAESENESWHSLDESLHLGTKAEGADQTVSEATMANPNTKDSTAQAHYPNDGEYDHGRLLIIAGEYHKTSLRENEAQPVDVVAIHGIYGDRKDTWMTDKMTNQLRTSWLHQIHEDNPNSRIMTFGYDASHTEAGLYTMGRIRDQALQLLNDLVKLRRGRNLVSVYLQLINKARPLVFISHDLGGIIVKMIFFGCPHRCSSTQDMEDKIGSFLRPCSIAYNIRGLGRSIVEINEAFFATKVPLITNILNVYSEEIGTSVEIFDKYTSTLDFPLERRVRCQRPHRDMCNMAANSELYAHIYRHIHRAASRLSVSDVSVKLLRILWFLAAPVHPIERLNTSDARLDWMAAHQIYKTWFRGQKPSILHIQGVRDTTDASDFILQHLNAYRQARQKRDILAYFTFKKHDDRYNSVIAMLTTLLIQIFSECHDIYNAVRLPFEEMLHHSSWTQAELLLLFQNMLSSWDHEGILCVINAINECEDSCTAFLSDICSLAENTERRFKIAITSTSDCNSQNELAGVPTINLDSHQADARSSLASDIDLGVLELVQQRPKFSDFEKTITAKLSICGQDRDWRCLVLNQLRFGNSPPTKLGIEQQLKVLPPTTPREIFVHIISGVPLEKKEWARRVLIWTLYTFHPLSVWELSTALMLLDEGVSNDVGDFGVVAYQDIIAELDRVFQGMFIIKHNEVHFGHPDAREFFLNMDCEWENAWYNVREIAHQQITDACFFYLSMVHERRFVAGSYVCSPAELPESPIYSPGCGFGSYAIKYWPRHYKIIYKKGHPTKSLARFWRNTRAMQLWAQAYWALRNPTRQTEGMFSSMLPIVAGLGLQDVETAWLDLKTRPDYINDCAAALAEAARHANINAVRTLLPICGYSKSNLEDALSAGSSCCDRQILNLLVTNIAEHRDAIQWPPALLCRAAQFGLKNVAKSLLKFGASLDAAVTFHKSTPLHLAARHGHAEVVQVLLEEGAKVTTLDEDGRTPLHVASKYNQLSVLSLLLDARADCNIADKYNATALDIACDNGNHVVVQILLMNPECDTGSDRQSISSPSPPLSVATSRGFFSCAKFLLAKNASTEVLGKGGRTPLYDAALHGRSELCGLLLQHGAEPNISIDEDPVLVEVATSGTLEIVKLLLENGAAVDATNSDDMTALQEASKNGHKAIVAHLLDNGADVNHGSGRGSTPIHLAASNGFAETVQLLIDSGADVQSPSPLGWTPLHLCYDHPETTHVLLKSGAEVNSITANGRTPLFLAACNNYPQVVKALLAYNPELEVSIFKGIKIHDRSPLTAAVENGSAEVTRLLLEAGANINHQDHRGSAPLHYAAAQNEVDVMRILMEYNPKVDLIDGDGNTALNCIDSDTSIMIAKILVNGGADCNIPNRNQNTPICTAALLQNTKILEYLTKRADLNVGGGSRGGPLHIACYLADLQLVKMLVASGANVNLNDPTVGTPLQSACCCRESSNAEQESIILYLINEVDVDLGITGGFYGCAINAACGRSNSEIVEILLEKGASIQVKDEMGRMAIHFAAAQSEENFYTILTAGADVKAADKMGRTTLHWASVGGMVQVINQIISVSRDLVNQGDVNGWTPLLWAARGGSTKHRSVSPREQEEVIKLLLNNGANPCIRTKVLDQDWSPAKVARFHGVDINVVRLLEEKAKEKLHDTGSGESWDEKDHESKRAHSKLATCKFCLSFIHGTQYQCDTCLEFDLCFTCYSSGKIMHLFDNPSHGFETIGDEYTIESVWPSDSESENDDKEEEERENESE